MAADNPLAWLIKAPVGNAPGEPGWSDTQRHEVAAAAGQGEPLNVKFVWECPEEHKVFAEWLAALSPEERAAVDAKVRPRVQARVAERKV